MDYVIRLLLDSLRVELTFIKISKLLGHKDIKTTQRYAHHCPDSLRDGVEILETDYSLTTVAEKAVVSSGENCHKSLKNKLRPEGIEPSTH